MTNRGLEFQCSLLSQRHVLLPSWSQQRSDVKKMRFLFVVLSNNLHKTTNRGYFGIIHSTEGIKGKAEG